jgi:hypothetical protein
VLAIGDDDEQLGLQHWASMRCAPTLVVVVPDAIDVQFSLRLRTDGLLLVPNILEDVVPMLRLMKKFFKAPPFIVIYRLSQIPSRMEQKGRSHSSNHRLFASIWCELKRMALTNRWEMMVIDHEKIMGKKNSALLRRLFPEHTITKD